MRRFLIVQIDGLSHRVLMRAVAEGYAPTLGHLRGRGFDLHRLPAGLPTSTPAFQAALMYGGAVDIPAFEYLDKATRSFHWFHQPWTAAAVEASHADGQQGIMRGGRTYGCVFSGSASDAILTFSQLLRPSRGWRHLGAKRMLVPVALLAWVTAKLAVSSAAEALAALGGRLRPRRRLPLKKRLLSRWLREFSTLAVTADLYAGVPALYVNFVGYDEAAHSLGPDDRAALRELRRIDRSIKDIWHVVRRLPELGYDLYVLSDHGQTSSVPFAQVAGGASLGQVVLDALGLDGEPVPERGWTGIWSGDLCIVPAGPNLNLYLTDHPGHASEDELEARYPGALARLSRHPGMGVVLTRGRAGMVCYYRGRAIRAPLSPGDSRCPLFDRPDRALVLRYLAELLAMPSGGDVIVFGHYAPDGCISYLGELGSHAGPSEDELYGFVLAPRTVAFDFAGVGGPRDLHPLFDGYHDHTSAGLGE